MTRIAVHGRTGRMGRLVADEIEAAPDLTLAEEADADVIVDFSSPEGLLALLQRARVAVVSGTTGVALPDVSIPFLHAPNFSLGVAVLARLVREATAALPGFDVEIVEKHHKAKKDAPSGTALRLAPGPVPIHSIRAGDIVGEHTIYLCGPGERLELTHVATDRRLFAIGAVRCARWMVGKPPGRYSLEDVLG